MQGGEGDVWGNELGQKGWLDGWTPPLLLHVALQLQICITAQAPAGASTHTHIQIVLCTLYPAGS